MTYPSFYDPQRVGQMYAPNVQAATLAGQALKLSPADSDTFKTALLLVDVQVDFIHTDGALSVPNAVAETRRTVEWMYRHVGEITTIFASLDSHTPLQIFFPAWWVDSHGHHTAPYTVITHADVQRGLWQPLYEAAWSKEYLERLEEHAKKQLMIWPYHTLLGTLGHSITPSVYEAIAYQTAARQAAPVWMSKGLHPKTENYSIFEPEVKLDELPNGGLDTARLDLLAQYDRVYIMGQAKSHCVLETVASMMRYYADAPQTIAKLYAVTDCMSSVAHPEIDFERIAVEAFNRFAHQGLQLVTTATN